MLEMCDFQGLEREKYHFPLDRGQLLTSCFYHLGSERWSHNLDLELFKQFLAFYDANA